LSSFLGEATEEHDDFENHVNRKGDKEEFKDGLDELAISDLPDG